MRIKEGFILKQVAKQYVVVPVGKNAINFNGMITLNHSAKLLFDALEKDATEQDLVNVLLEAYDISEEFALRDVRSFINTLEEKNVIE
ncbi:MAG: PqqD family protein [Tenericutes bacterium HGW-Tenericutes-6]|nr:MAG: PqqD family protein [Tenericutes bacterium HGW-Tenericutes-6]